LGYDHGKAILAEGIKGVVVAEYTPEKDTRKFTWILAASPGFELTLRAAYKVTKQQNREKLEPLIIKTQKDEILVEVSECDIGDRLISIIGVSNRRGTVMPEDLASAKVIYSEFR